MPMRSVKKNGALTIRIASLISGAAGLMYEIAWVRRLADLFGSSELSLSIVLAVFFTGLAAGGFYYGNRSRRKRDDLKKLVHLELTVAVLGGAALLMYYGAEFLYGNLYPLISSQVWLLNLLRGILAAAVLFPATFFAGGTLPLLVRTASSRGSVEKGTARIYFINTLGACVGVLLTGFVLIPAVGAVYSLVIALALNVIAAVLFRSVSRSSATRVQTSGEEHSQLRPFSKMPVLYGSAFFITGFASLGAEVLWSRFLSILFTNTVYTYTITVAVVLAGIFSGSYLVTRISLQREKLRSFYTTLLLISAGSTLFFVYLPPAVWNSLRGSESLAVQVAGAALLLYVPAVISGMLFPLGVRLLAADRDESAFAAGRVVFLNTLGGVTGSLLAGFIIIPLLGMGSGFYLLSGLLLAVGVAFAFSETRSSSMHIPLAAAILLFLAVYPRFTGANIPLSYYSDHGEVISHVEGVASDIIVSRTPAGRTLSVNGLWQGESRKNRQIMAAHIPMLIHEDPRSIALVGLGAGQTGERFLMYDIDSLFCIDIEREIFDVARRYFSADWLADPRVVPVYDDGRSFLKYTDRTFDLISLEVGQTFRPYLASFYSVDFYRSIEGRLNKNGMVSQFLPMGAMTRDMFLRAIRSFTEVFPQAVLWYNTSELLLIGRADGEDPPKLTAERLDRMQNDPTLHDDLSFRYWGTAQNSLNNPSVFLGGFICGDSTLNAFTADQTPYYDSPPELEYAAARVRSVTPYIDLIDSMTAPFDVGADLTDMDADTSFSRGVRRLNLKNIQANVYHQQYMESGNATYLKKAVRTNPGNMKVTRLLVDHYITEEKLDSALVYIRQYLGADPANHKMLTNAGSIHYYKKNFTVAEGFFREALKYDQSAKILNNLGKALAGQGQYMEAMQAFQAARKKAPDNYEYQQNLRKVMDILQSGGGGPREQ
ncbi:MAG: fused MFS/spermidine synthase [Fibrobacterota bacterium]